MMKKLSLDQLGRPSSEVFAQMEKIPIVVFLDNIRSAMNVGSIFRTADAFKIEKIILGGITACPPHKEILKTAIGAQDTVLWEHCTDISPLLALKEDGYQLIGVEQTDQSLRLNDFRVDTHQKYCLIFGNEVEGIQDVLLPLLDTAIEIPQFGTKHSLNVSVCAGIVLWRFARPYLC